MLSTAQLDRAIRSGKPELVNLAKKYLDLLQAETATNSFKSFVKLFWPAVSPTPLRAGWYLDAICDHLQNLPSLKRLVINIPPRHGKSSIVSVLYPAWLWITKPETKFICSSYSLKELSTRDSIACRSVIDSYLYQQQWCHLYQLSVDQNTKTRFGNDKLGFRLATSIESANLGEGCDILVADDLNNLNRNSEADRQTVIQWWTQVMSTRMNPGGMDCKVVIQQRCHEEDITGYILRQDEANLWTHLVLPWEFDPAKRTTTSLPWSDPRTEEGEPLSNLLTDEKVKELRGGNGLGPTGFATQFNQRPAPKTGNIFQSHWFRTFHETDDLYVLGDVKVKKADCRLFTTTDLAISLKTSADWTVASTWAVTPHNHMLLIDEWRERVEGPDAIKGFKRLIERWHPEVMYVEDVAYQRLMIQMLKRDGLPVRAISPGSLDKLARCQRALVKAECGQIWLADADWTKEWLEEITVFPNARFDDRLDCLAYAGIIVAKYGIHDLPSVEKVDREELLRKKEAEIMGGY